MPCQQTRNKMILYAVFVGTIATLFGILTLYDKMESVGKTFQHFGDYFYRFNAVNEREEDRIFNENTRKGIGKIKKKINVIIERIDVETKTGVKFLGESRKNFALGSSGADIIDIKDGRTYTLIWKRFEIRYCKNNAKTILDPSLLTGYCFVFAKNKVSVTIKLTSKAFIESVAIGHILSKQSPDEQINSAPKDYKVYGSNEPFDPKPDFIGSFSYNIKISKPFQSFPVKISPPKSYSYVKFDFLTNHGNQESICVYSISVFGTRDQSIDVKKIPELS